MQVHAFLIAAIVVWEWLISHSPVYNCGRRVNGIEINSSPVHVMNTTDTKLILPRKNGRRHKLFYHTRVMYSSSSSSSSSSSYIYHGVGPLVVPFQPHVSRSLFQVLPRFLLPAGE